MVSLMSWDCELEPESTKGLVSFLFLKFLIRSQISEVGVLWLNCEQYFFHPNLFGLLRAFKHLDLTFLYAIKLAGEGYARYLLMAS